MDIPAGSKAGDFQRTAVPAGGKAISGQCTVICSFQRLTRSQIMFFLQSLITFSFAPLAGFPIPHFTLFWNFTTLNEKIRSPNTPMGMTFFARNRNEEPFWKMSRTM